MSRKRYLYALAGAGCGDPLGEGSAGEPLCRLEVGPVAAILGERDAVPDVTPEALAAHDAVVRRLAERLPALLPARFGQTPGERTLSAWIAVREREVVEALALVDGCVQMNLRVFAGREAQEAPLPEPDSVPEDLGPGARFLHARREAAARAHALPEIAPLREALRPLLRAERVERLDPRADLFGKKGRLRATACDLVLRGEADAYKRIVAETEPRLAAGWGVTVTGPWPPYAFAPEAIR